MAANSELLDQPTETKRERTDKPEMPVEIWGLWSGYHWVPPIDSHAGADVSFLAFDNEQDAQKSADYHNESFELHCRPVRLK